MPHAVSACAGPCNTAWRAAEKEKKTTGALHDLTPRDGEPVWCAWCARTAQSALRSLPTDAALLSVEIDNGTSNAPERVSGSRERPLHPRDGLARMIDDIADLLTTWEDDVRHWRGFTPRTRWVRGRAISNATRFLDVQFAWVITDHPFREASVAFVREVSETHRHVQRVVHAHEQQPERCIGVRCPRCGWKALVREVVDGKRTGYVACQQCSRLLTESEYHIAVHASAAGLKKIAKAVA